MVGLTRVHCSFTFCQVCVFICTFILVCVELAYVLTIICNVRICICTVHMSAVQYAHTVLPVKIQKSNYYSSV